NKSMLMACTFLRHSRQLRVLLLPQFINPALEKTTKLLVVGVIPQQGVRNGQLPHMYINTLYFAGRVFPIGGAHLRVIDSDVEQTMQLSPHRRQGKGQTTRPRNQQMLVG